MNCMWDIDCSMWDTKALHVMLRVLIAMLSVGTVCVGNVGYIIHIEKLWLSW